MIYDAYAHVPLYGLDLGFVGRGEAIDFIRSRARHSRRLAPDEHQRRRPALHPHRHVRDVRDPGAVRQLRGDAYEFAQVAGVRTSFVQGIGGMFGAAGALVLGVG